MTDIDADALKEPCDNCEEDHIHTSHGRCLGCLTRGLEDVAGAAALLADATGRSVEEFTSEAEIPELDELESVDE